MEEIEELKTKISGLEETLGRQLKIIATLEARVKDYELDGPAMLYYSLNRKAQELASLLNGNDFRKLDIEDPKNKSFERLIVVIKNATDVATAVKSLGEVSGVTGDEEKDTKRRPVTPESMANVLGNSGR